MTQQTRQRILEYIKGEWCGLSSEYRPSAVWIRCHDPIETGMEPVPADIPIRAVWYLDNNGLQERSLTEFAVFWAVHFDQPWCTKPYRERDSHFSTGTFLIGLAGFAPYSGIESIYVEMQWGGLHGYGFRVTVSDKGVSEDALLWRS